MLPLVLPGCLSDPFCLPTFWRYRLTLLSAMGSLIASASK